jgi:hypothetical protein
MPAKRYRFRKLLAEALLARCRVFGDLQRIWRNCKARHSIRQGCKLCWWSCA